MKPSHKEFLRWSIILLCGGFGLWTLLHDGYFHFERHSGDGIVTKVGVLAIALFAAIPLLIAYMAFRGQYHQLVIVAAAVVSLILCGVLMSLPRQLGFNELLDSLRQRPISTPSDDLPLVLLGLLHAFFALIFPFWAASRFFRYLLQIARHRLYGSTPKIRNA